MMVMYKPYPLTLDTKDREQPPLIYFHQDDYNTAKIIVYLKEDGQPLSLTQAKVRIVLRKYDQTVGYLDCDVLDQDKGIVEVILSSNSLSCPGTVTCELYISKDSHTLVTPRFKYIVDEALFPSGMIQSSNEYPVLMKLIKDSEVAQFRFEEATANVDSKVNEALELFNETTQKEINSLSTKINENITQFNMIQGLNENIFTYSYELDGSIKTITEKDKNNVVISMTTFTYSVKGDVDTSVKVMNGKIVTTKYNYDENGNLTNTINTMS
ncbi:hypothetical protein COE51_16320 [Bacillus pseudomycoides]|nr:hypothetical protein COE51_16320 [Bacillus pseudomycoides]